MTTTKLHMNLKLMEKVEKYLPKATQAARTKQYIHILKYSQFLKWLEIILHNVSAFSVLSVKSCWWFHLLFCILCEERGGGHSANTSLNNTLLIIT